MMAGSVYKIKPGIGINGGNGRIGKLNHNQLYELSKPWGGLLVAAINDLAPTEEIVRSYSRRDQTHGDLGWEVKQSGKNEISIDGNTVADCPLFFYFY
ncbi:MAG: hypothetical protein O2779_01670 [Nanoarchaeota archaeon]|nr:hypothetical protein [Nanoarchaeota archaeon]